MSSIAKLNREQARRNPEAEFESPQQLLEQVALTRAEKRTALEAWEFAVRRRLDSSSEGMQPTQPVLSGDAVVPDPISRDTELLREIELCLESVKKGNEDGAEKAGEKDKS